MRSEDLGEALKAVPYLMRGFPSFWCVAGGWAIDLYLGRVTRSHGDVELAIFRQDQSLLHTHFSDWRFGQSRGWASHRLGLGRVSFSADPRNSCADQHRSSAFARVPFERSCRRCLGISSELKCDASARSGHTPGTRGFSDPQSWNRLAIQGQKFARERRIGLSSHPERTVPRTIADGYVVRC